MAAESLKDLMVRVFFGADEASATATENRVAGVASTVSKAFAFNEIKEAATGVFDIVRGGFEKINDVAKHADEIGDLADKIGISADELEFFQFAAEDAGASADSITMGFKAMSQQIGAASEGSKEAAAAFSSIGVALRENGQLRGAGDVFNDVITKLQEIKNPTEQAAKAQNIFGRAWQDVRLAIKGGPQQLAKLREEFEGLGLAITPEFLELSDRYDKSIRRLGKSWEGFKRTALEPVIKSFNSLIEKFLEWYRINRFDIGKIASEQFQSLMDIFKAFADVVKALTPTIGDLFKEIDHLVGNMGPWGGIVRGFGDILKLAFVSPKAAVAALIATLSQDLINFFYDKGPTALGFFRANWDKEMARLRASGHDTFASLAESVKGYFEFAKKALTLQSAYLVSFGELVKRLKSGDLSGATDVLKTLASPAKMQAQVATMELKQELGRKFDRLPPEQLNTMVEDVMRQRGAAGLSNKGLEAPTMSVQEVNMSVYPGPGMDERELAKKVKEEFEQNMSSTVRKTHSNKVPASK